MKSIADEYVLRSDYESIYSPCMNETRCRIMSDISWLVLSFLVPTPPSLSKTEHASNRPDPFTESNLNMVVSGLSKPTTNKMHPAVARLLRETYYVVLL